MSKVQITTVEGKSYLHMFDAVTRRYSIMGSAGETTNVECIGSARLTRKGEIAGRSWNGSDFRYSYAAQAARNWVAAGKPTTFETEV